MWPLSFSENFIDFGLFFTADEIFTDVFLWFRIFYFKLISLHVLLYQIFKSPSPPTTLPAWWFQITYSHTRGKGILIFLIHGTSFFNTWVYLLFRMCIYHTYWRRWMWEVSRMIIRARGCKTVVVIAFFYQTFTRFPKEAELKRYSFQESYLVVRRNRYCCQLYCFRLQ